MSDHMGHNQALSLPNWNITNDLAVQRAPLVVFNLSWSAQAADDPQTITKNGSDRPRKRHNLSRSLNRLFGQAIATLVQHEFNGASIDDHFNHNQKIIVSAIFDHHEFSCEHIWEQGYHSTYVIVSNLLS